MNYEEKYNQALEKLRAFHRDYKNISHLVDVKEELESIFPELRESEDERIRKEIYRYFRDLQLSSDREFSPSTSIDEILSWLEKQGEQKSWSEDDEQNLNFWLDNNKSIDSDKRNWLKLLKDRVQPQPKQEWSEYDKIQLSEAIQMIEANGTWIRSEDAVKKVSNWLKSLKPNHWKPSEEQLETLRNAIVYVEGCDSNFRGGHVLELLYNELKQL